MINNAEDLKKVLADEIDKLREGKTTPKEANAVTQLAGKLISLVKLEIEYNKDKYNNPSEPLIPFMNREQKALTE